MAEPVEDAPPPEEQDQALVEAGFESNTPSNPSLICGFGLPIFTLSINLPGFQFPPFDFPPELNLALALNCDLSNPIDAELSFGGGRVGTRDPDPDEIDE